MFDKFLSRKLVVFILTIFVLFLIYLIPANDDNEYNLSFDNIEYVYTNTKATLYLLDSNDYVARTSVSGCDCDVLGEARNSLKKLIVGESWDNDMPNGFRAIIPTGTEIIDMSLDDKVLTVNFSDEILNVNSKYEEKMISAIVYTLTSIDGIDKVSIKVSGNDLDKLPNSGKRLDSILDKGYGINKSYDISTVHDIDSYTVYYVSSYNDDTYYVPVTKYVNNTNRDKVKVIIDELSSSPIHEDNLMSYLNANTNLINYDLDNDILKLNFDKYILNDSESNKILEEVIYTISLSFLDNYNVREVDFLINDEEIYKNELKTLE